MKKTYVDVLLALPPDKYEQWQQITFNFDPRDMF